MDAELHPVTENVQMMLKLLPRKIGDKSIVKFSQGPCSADVQMDQRKGDHSCAAGVFLELVKQPQLGLLHQDMEKELKIAHVSSKGCHAEYSLICSNGVYEIKEPVLFQNGSAFGAVGVASLHEWAISGSVERHLGGLLGDLLWQRLLCEPLIQCLGPHLGHGSACTHPRGGMCAALGAQRASRVGEGARQRRAAEAALDRQEEGRRLSLSSLISSFFSSLRS